MCVEKQLNWEGEALVYPSATAVVMQRNKHPEPQWLTTTDIYFLLVGLWFGWVLLQASDWV